MVMPRLHCSSRADQQGELEMLAKPDMHGVLVSAVEESACHAAELLQQLCAVLPCRPCRHVAFSGSPVQACHVCRGSWLQQQSENGRLSQSHSSLLIGKHTAQDLPYVAQICQDIAHMPINIDNHLCKRQVRHNTPRLCCPGLLLAQGQAKHCTQQLQLVRTPALRPWRLAGGTSTQSAAAPPFAGPTMPVLVSQADRA